MGLSIQVWACDDTEPPLALKVAPRSKHRLQLPLELVQFVGSLAEPLGQRHARLHGHLPHVLNEIRRAETVCSPRCLQRPYLLDRVRECFGKFRVADQRRAARAEIDGLAIGTGDASLLGTEVMIQLVLPDGGYLGPEQLVEQSHARRHVLLQLLLGAGVDVLQNLQPVGAGGSGVLSLHFRLSLPGRQRGRQGDVALAAIVQRGILHVHAKDGEEAHVQSSLPRRLAQSRVQFANLAASQQFREEFAPRFESDVEDRLQGAAQGHHLSFEFFRRIAALLLPLPLPLLRCDLQGHHESRVHVLQVCGDRILHRIVVSAAGGVNGPNERFVFGGEFGRLSRPGRLQFGHFGHRVVVVRLE
mmetsp:Transcript_35641/g.76100  ORF Transcript_35641/g.76100 Transcript_35641/m.76100 type:complete len:359 (-) Transcript_35641:38-1114(-)